MRKVVLLIVAVIAVLFYVCSRTEKEKSTVDVTKISIYDSTFANSLKNHTYQKGDSVETKYDEVINVKTSKEELLEYIESFSYVKKAVIADNEGLIVAVIPGEKNPEMLARTFLNQAKNSNVSVRYCKIVSAYGAKLNGNYITGKKLAMAYR